MWLRRSGGLGLTVIAVAYSAFGGEFSVTDLKALSTRSLAAEREVNRLSDELFALESSLQAALEDETVAVWEFRTRFGALSEGEVLLRPVVVRDGCGPFGDGTDPRYPHREEGPTTHGQEASGEHSDGV